MRFDTSVSAKLIVRVVFVFCVIYGVGAVENNGKAQGASARSERKERR